MPDMPVYGAVLAVVFTSSWAEGWMIFKDCPELKVSLPIRYAAYNFLPSFSRKTVSPYHICQAAGLLPEKYLIKHEGARGAKNIINIKLLKSFRYMTASLSFFALATAYALEFYESRERHRHKVLEGKCSPFELGWILPVEGSEPKKSGVAYRICDRSAFSLLLNNTQNETKGALTWGGAAVVPLVLDTCPSGECSGHFHDIIERATQNGTRPVYCSFQKDTKVLEQWTSLPMPSSWAFKPSIGQDFFLLECDFLSGIPARSPFKRSGSSNDELLLKMLQQALTSFDDPTKKGHCNHPFVRVFLVDSSKAKILSSLLLPNKANKNTVDLVIDGEAVVVNLILKWAESYRLSCLHNSPSYAPENLHDRKAVKSVSTFFENVGRITRFFFSQEYKCMAKIFQELHKLMLARADLTRLVVVQTDCSEIFHDLYFSLRRAGWYVISKELGSFLNQIESCRKLPVLAFCSSDFNLLNEVNEFCINKQVCTSTMLNSSSDAQLQMKPRHCIVQRNVAGFHGVQQSELCLGPHVICLQKIYDEIFEFIRAELCKGTSFSQLASQMVDIRTENVNLC